MNILVLSWRDPKHPLAGGAEQVMHEHMKGWMKNGHRVTFFSSKMAGLKSMEDIDGVEIVRDGYQYWGVQFKAFFYYLKHKDNFDLVVDEFHGIPFFTPLYVKKPKLAVIQETAGKVWLLNPLPWPINWVIGIIGFLGERFIFLLFYRNTQFMTGSESAREDVAKFGIAKKNIHIVPHGVVLKVPKTTTKEKKFTVVFLGILSKDKGIEDAIRCFALLRQEDIQFWVIGRFETSEYEKKVKRLIDELNIKNRIKLWGFVSQEDKFSLLSRAHVLINPSVREGWGLVNIEANSVGMIVVAYNSPGLVDSVRNNISGIIVSENNPKSLALSIRSLFSDPVRMAKLSKLAISWSKNFSWDKSAKMSLDLIKQVTNEQSFFLQK